MDSLPRDTGGEIIATNCEIRTFGYPDKKTRDQLFRARYDGDRRRGWNLKKNWRGLCVYERVHVGQLVEAHIWYPYRTWKGKAIIDSQTVGHEMAHVIDTYMRLAGGKDVAHPDKITQEEWWV